MVDTVPVNISSEVKMNRFACVLVFGVGFLVDDGVWADEERVPLDKLPKVVREAVEKRFPKVEMKEASKERDGDKVVYEITIEKDGKATDVTVTEAGAIILIEQEIEFKDLPTPVVKRFEEKYPRAKYKAVESVTRVAHGKETLAYYEVKLVDADNRTWEIEILPDGKFKSASEVKK